MGLGPLAHSSLRKKNLLGDFYTHKPISYPHNYPQWGIRFIEEMVKRHRAEIENFQRGRGFIKNFSMGRKLSTPLDFSKFFSYLYRVVGREKITFGGLKKSGKKFGNVKYFSDLYGVINEIDMKSDYQAGRDRVIEELEKEFSILNICDVMDWIYWTFAPDKKPWEMDYSEETRYVKEFCQNFGVMLYERPRSSFFKGEGIQMGLEGGWKGVILSDLS